MRTAVVAAVTMALSAAAMGMAPQSAQAVGSVYYVSPGGDDSAAGGQQAPLRTIQHCADIARPGDTCRILTGDYHETVTPPTSGTAAAPIRFEAAPGAQVTVDGTDAVTGWTLDSGSIYKAPVTLAGTASAPYGSSVDPSNTDLWANQVFTGGTPVPEAAYPAAGAGVWGANYVSSGWSGALTSGGTCSAAPCTSTGTGTLTYSGFPALGDLTGATVQLAGHWVTTTSTVSAGNLDGTNKTLRLTFPNSDSPEMIGGSSPKFRLVGKKSFLRAPDQWFYDAGSKQLFMWAADGKAPQNVSAKKRNYGFDLDGRSSIVVDGIKLFGTTIRTDDSSSDITLSRIDATYLSEWQTTQYRSDLPYAGIYAGNHRADSGIQLHGRDNELLDSHIRYSGGAGVSLKGSGQVIRDNLITDAAYNGTYSAAITVEDGIQSSAIVHNTMRSTGRDMINLNTNAYPNAGYDLRIAYNDMSDYARIGQDLGAIYVCCDTSLRGRIDHNTIHNPSQVGNGLHFDNGTIDVNVDHNVIWGLGSNSVGGYGVAQGGWSAGHDLPYLKGSYTNNTIVTPDRSTIFNYYATAAQVANTTARNNILDGDKPADQSYAYIAGGTPNESNDLATKYSQNPAANTPAPGYTDFAANDFTLAPGSPAIDAGTPVAGVTDGYAGAAPDQGAYEAGQATWLSGCTFTPECGDASMSKVTIVARHSGKDVGVDGTAAQTTQQTDSGSAAQQWAVLPQAGGTAQIKNLATGLCLAVAGQRTDDLAPVYQWACSTAPNFLWNVRDTEGGYQQIVGAQSGKCLNVYGLSTADGAGLIQYTCSEVGNMEFTLQPIK
ncbi:RICIN domain-containing protein [Streptomyces sp. NBC_00448]|uniref:RICIN domain-containing protein n=1 Tax=Streptomyces sp. NBC_00448 TaxID=2903652 RepID=UPI002E1A7550